MSVRRLIKHVVKRTVRGVIAGDSGIVPPINNRITADGNDRITADGNRRIVAGA